MVGEKIEHLVKTSIASLSSAYGAFALWHPV